MNWKLKKNKIKTFLVFTVTFDQFNASLLKKSIYFLKKPWALYCNVHLYLKRKNAPKFNTWIWDLCKSLTLSMSNSNASITKYICHKKKKKTELTPSKIWDEVP